MRKFAHLFVHEYIDDGVVDGGALGKVGRHGSSQRMECISRVSSCEAGKDCVWPPAGAKGNDHDNHHSGHLLLCLLC